MVSDVRRFDWTHRSRVRDGESAVEAVVRAVSDVEGCRPEDLSPLQSVVDGDALNSLVRETGLHSRTSVEFEFEGYLVAVTGSEVRLRVLA